MRIADRVFELLRKQGPKTTRNIIKHLPDLHGPSVRAVVSNDQVLFIKIGDKIGLKNVHDHLLRKQHNVVWGKLVLYQRIVNLLVCGPMSIENICHGMPYVSKLEILQEVDKHPDLFIHVKEGWIGRKGRDEQLQKKYGNASRN